MAWTLALPADGHSVIAWAPLFALETPLSTPTAIKAEKAATTAERSSLLRIVGFILT